jgi:hypothetical protein
MAKAIVKRPRGAPTTYREEYCEQVISHMSRGFSFESFAGVISVNRDTLYEWCHVHHDFSDAKKIAVQKSLLALETIGLDGMTGELKGFNVASWIFTCKNRHSDMFKDKMEIGTVDNKPFVLKYSLDD